MTRTADAVVVGGGMLGSAVAYHLARADVATLLIDRDDDGRATTAGAGSIGPATSSQTADDDWYELAMAAAKYYPDLTADLDAAGVEETSYDRCGTIAVAVGDDELRPFEAALERIEDRGLDAVEEIDPAEAQDMVPPLTDAQRAFHDPTAARVEGQTFAEALRTAARQQGLEILDDSVTKLRILGSEIAGVETAHSGAVDADQVVVAGGAWSAGFAADLDIDIPVEPQRGQIVHLDVDAPTANWPIIKGFRHHYIVPWAGGRAVAGATREDGVGHDPRLTAEGVRTVLDEALRVAPGLCDASLAELRVGLRPLSADGLPVLGPVPGVKGAYLATGHGPTGLTLGPYSGKLAAKSVRGENAVPEPFRVDRFLESSAK